MLGIVNSCFCREKMGMRSCGMIFFCSDKDLILSIQILCDECFLPKILVWNSEPSMFSKTGVKQMPRNQETWPSTSQTFLGQNMDYIFRNEMSCMKNPLQSLERLQAFKGLVSLDTFQLLFICYMLFFWAPQSSS